MVFLGDLHGNFEYVKYIIKTKQISDQTIIQVGDFGAGFINEARQIEVFELLNKFLKLRNIIMYVIRGNHDDPHYFKGNHQYSNLKLMSDYSVLELEDRKILMIGGAISIDRKSRLANDTINSKYGSDQKSYWFDELVVKDDEKLAQLTGCDLLVTHTAPDWCFPLNKIGFGSLVESFAQDDPELLNDLKSERKLMSDIFNTIQKQNSIKDHFYGHFHRSDITMNGYCNHYLLGINELREI